MDLITASKLLVSILALAVLTASMCASGNVIDEVRESADIHSTAAETREEKIREMRGLGYLQGEFNEWHVSAKAAADGSGSADSPMTLKDALEPVLRGGRIKPGDLIWIHGGTYLGAFTSRLQGTADLPIHVRQFPGDRAILDKGSASRSIGGLDVRGSHVWFWDIEVTNSFPERSRNDEKGELNPWRGSGINVYAPNTRYINLVVHDNGHGFGLWNEDGGTEIYGCLIFNNGNNKKEHGIYGHNKRGTTLISDNVIFNNAGYGIHLYANSIKSSVSGFRLKGNVVFNNGSLMKEDQVADEILIGGVEGVAADDIELDSNYVYDSPRAAPSKNRGVRLGYEHRRNGSVRLLNNYIVSRVPLRILWWTSIEATGNVVMTERNGVEVSTPDGGQAPERSWDSNKFISQNGRAKFVIDGTELSMDQWKKGRELDRRRSDVSLRTDELSAADVFVRQSRYSPSRSLLIVMNWSARTSVSVDPGESLTKDRKFEILDVEDPFGASLISGTYNGDRIRVPMNHGAVAKARGNVEVQPVHTGPNFGVFLIMQR